MPNGFEGQNEQGLNPVFQNIGAQQSNQNMAMQQGNQFAQEAGQTQNGAGANQLAMAMALRKKQPETMGGQTPNYSNPYTNTGGYFDQNAYGNIYGVGTGGFE